MGWWQYWNWKIKKMPRERAIKIRHRLSVVYAFSAWNAFALLVYFSVKHGNPPDEEEAKYPSKYYAKLVGTDNAKVYKLSGFTLTHEYDIDGKGLPKPKSWIIQEREKREERERLEREGEDRQDLDLLVEETGSL